MHGQFAGAVLADGEVLFVFEATNEKENKDKKEKKQKRLLGVHKIFSEFSAFTHHVLRIASCAFRNPL
jgi:hypothetical protein